MLPAVAVYRRASHANAHRRMGMRTAGRAECLQAADRARAKGMATRAKYPHQPESAVALDGQAREGSRGILFMNAGPAGIHTARLRSSVCPPVPR